MPGEDDIERAAQAYRDAQRAANDPGQAEHAEAQRAAALAADHEAMIDMALTDHGAGGTVRATAVFVAVFAATAAFVALVHPRTENALLIEVVVAGFGWLLLSAVLNDLWKGRVASRRRGALDDIGRGFDAARYRQELGVRRRHSRVRITLTPGHAESHKDDIPDAIRRWLPDIPRPVWLDDGQRLRIDSGELRTIERTQNPRGGNYSFFTNAPCHLFFASFLAKVLPKLEARGPVELLEVEIDGERAGDDEDPNR